MDTRELKPCPFCGMNLFFDHNSFTWMHPKYPCPAAGYEPFRTDDEWAANKWNTRASDAALSSQAAEIERLRAENAHLDHAAAAMSKDLFRVTAGNELATAEIERLKEALDKAAGLCDEMVGEGGPLFAGVADRIRALSPKPNKEGE